MTEKTGGPVFPCKIPTGGLHKNDEPAPTKQHYGMTLRDYFAAKAMPAVITDWLNTGDIFQDAEIPEVIAMDCYIVADAMLKARKQ